MLFLILIAAAIVAFFVVKKLVEKQKQQEKTSLVEEPVLYTLPEKEETVLEELAVEVVEVPTVEAPVTVDKPKRKRTTTKKEGAVPKMSAKKKTNGQSK